MEKTLPFLKNVIDKALIELMRSEIVETSIIKEDNVITYKIYLNEDPV